MATMGTVKPLGVQGVVLGSHLLFFNLGSWYPGKQAAGGYGEQYKKVKYFCPFWFPRESLKSYILFVFLRKTFIYLLGLGREHWGKNGKEEDKLGIIRHSCT